MLKPRVVAFVAVVAVSLLGCAKAYLQPDISTNTATVSFYAESNNLLGFTGSLWLVENVTSKPCSDPIARMAVVSKGNPLVRTDNRPNIPVIAGKPTTLRVVMVINAGSVQVTTKNISFVPVPDRKYRVTVSDVGGGSVIGVDVMEEGGFWV